MPGLFLILLLGADLDIPHLHLLPTASWDEVWGSTRAPNFRPMSSSGKVDWCSPGVCPTFLWSLDQSPDATVTPEIGPALKRTGTPTRVTDGTYPSGVSGSQGYGYLFSGTTGLMGYCIDDAEMIAGGLMPAGSFTIVADVTPLYVSAQNHIAGVWVQTSNQRSWALLQTSATSVSGWFSQDGSTTCMNNANAKVLNGKRSFIALTYTYVPGGNSPSSLIIDGIVQNNSQSCGPVYDGSTQKFQVAANGSSSTTCAGASGSGYAGIIHNIAYYNGTVLSTAQIEDLRSQNLQTFSSLKSPLSVTSATPHAVMVAAPNSGTEPYFVILPANTVFVGPYGVYFGGSYTNRIPRAVFESCSAGHPTGWDVVEAGASAWVDCVTSTYAGGSQAVKLENGPGVFTSAIKSGCRTAGMASDLYVELNVKTISGTGHTEVYLEQYTAAADCTGAQTDTNVIGTTSYGSSWTYTGALYPAASWAGGTQSYKLVIREDCSGGCATIVDNVSARSASSPSDSFCGCDSDVDCTCSGSVATYDKNPLKIGGWTLTAKVRTPIAGSTNGPIRYIARVPATSGSNNIHSFYWNNGYVKYDCYSSAGALVAVSRTDSAGANTEHTYMAQHTETGDVRVCWDGSCSAWASGCTNDGISSTFQVGQGASTPGEVWLKDVKVYYGIVRP